MNPVPYSLVNLPNYPHSIGYSPTGLDLGVLGSGRLFWALVGRVGLGYAVQYLSLQMSM